MNPLLHELSGPPRSLAEVVRLLEHHIGDGTSEIRCRQAVEALRLMRRYNPSFHVRAALRALDGDATPCTQVRAVIKTIRQWHHYSGA